MIWKKLKKLIIPLIIAKLIILVFFIIKSDVISISRDIYTSSNYHEGFDNDSIAQKRQKFIRIVRNEEENGILIKLRGKKNAKYFREIEVDRSVPIVD